VKLNNLRKGNLRKKGNQGIWGGPHGGQGLRIAWRCSVQRVSSKVAHIDGEGWLHNERKWGWTTGVKRMQEFNEKKKGLVGEVGGKVGSWEGHGNCNNARKGKGGGGGREPKARASFVVFFAWQEGGKARGGGEKEMGKAIMDEG